MTLPVNKATTPFKTMDIKTALLSGASRKRKSTTQISKDEPKNKKPIVENSDHEKVEVLDEACGITVVLQPSEIDSTLGDCKENKDVNAAKLEYSQDNPKDSKPLNSSKEEKSHNLEKKTCSVSANEIEMLSDKSKNSGESSCDDHNYSLNGSLNSSELSITYENKEKGHRTESKPKDGQNKSDGKSQTDSKEKVKKKMTPAEAKKRAEKREQLLKEKLLKKQEYENKKKERELEKEQKLKEKKLKREREEIERKERERIKQEKKEQEEKERLKKQKEKEEKAKIKQIQLEQKLEEKKKKEEMRLKKEEEDKRAKLEKEQKEKEKQERAKAAFVKFFVKAGNNASNASTPSSQTSEKRAFLPFQVSDDMTLAPVVPPAAQERFDKKQFDQYLKFPDGKKLYLDVLKSGTYKDVRYRKKNKKIEVSEVIIIDQNAQAELGLHPKLLQFHENVRPPYWGTWRKKSKNIRPRNPFGQDEMFDYDVDSDDEWDEGGPGESLSGSENEVESEDEYEVDNEFFVPHGYLSDEEEKKEDDDEEVNDPEKQKALLKLKLQEFEMERKKKTTELKPIILGCYFVNDPAFQEPSTQKFLETYSAEFLTETPILTRFTVRSQQSGSDNNAGESPKSANNVSSFKRPVPEKAFPHLIRLVHGNIKNKRILAEEFQKFWLEQSREKSEGKQDNIKPSSNSETVSCKESVDDVPSDFLKISLTQITQSIKDIASYGKCPDPNFKKYCWWVRDSIREKYGLLDAPIPNQWKYVSQKEAEPSPKNNSARGLFSK